jgi:hypothetical protein
VYEGTPELRFDVLESMQGRCGDTAFVLHGGTGISDADFRRAISLGMHKINIATASFMAVHQAAQGAGAGWTGCWQGRSSLSAGKGGKGMSHLRPSVQCISIFPAALWP